MTIVSRLAPTPSGYLHIGNLYSFLLTWTIVKKQQGKLLLRIDDLDSTRVRKDYVDDIFETLAFMGISYDMGPVNTNDFYSNYSQQLRTTTYQQLLNQLVQTGKVYACTCSRRALVLNYVDEDPCLQQQLSLDIPHAAWRIHVPHGTLVQFHDTYRGPVSVDLRTSMPDFIIKRKDGIPAYQVASLCDDISYGVNTIIRGNDLLHSTAAQLYLASLCEQKDFLHTTFYHHPVLTTDGDKKLSKSAGSQSINALREAGKKPGHIIDMLQGLPGIDKDYIIQNVYNLFDS